MLLGDIGTYEKTTLRLYPRVFTWHGDSAEYDSGELSVVKLQNWTYRIFFCNRPSSIDSISAPEVFYEIRSIRQTTGHNINKTREEKTHSDTFSINWPRVGEPGEGVGWKAIKKHVERHRPKSINGKRRWQSRDILLFCCAYVNKQSVEFGVLGRNGKPFDNERKIKIFISKGILRARKQEGARRRVMMFQPLSGRLLWEGALNNSRWLSSPARRRGEKKR